LIKTSLLVISFHNRGCLTVGASFADSGATTGTDSTSVGARYSMTAGDVAITIGGATATTEVSGGADNDSQNVGIKLVSGSMSLLVSQSENTTANDDIQNSAMAVSYKMANGMVIGAYTFKSEDDSKINFLKSNQLIFDKNSIIPKIPYLKTTPINNT